MMIDSTEDNNFEEDIDMLAKKLEPIAEKFKPKIAIICGSGLGTLADSLENLIKMTYEELGLPQSTVQGHSGLLVFGAFNGVNIVCMKGRYHPYEGHHPKSCTKLIRAFKEVGVETVIITNASGGLNKSFKAGDIMVIKDHINVPGLAGLSPLCGPNCDRQGPRFPAMSNAYDRSLQALALKTAADLGHGGILHTGVYAMCFGPSFETIAEARFLRMVGADAVGMSTAHEVVVARHAGLRVLGLSLVSNKVVMDYDTLEVANHTEVMEMGQQRAEVMKEIVGAIVRQI